MTHFGTSVFVTPRRARFVELRSLIQLPYFARGESFPELTTDPFFSDFCYFSFSFLCVAL